MFLHILWKSNVSEKETAFSLSGTLLLRGYLLLSAQVLTVRFRSVMQSVLLCVLFLNVLLL